MGRKSILFCTEHNKNREKIGKRGFFVCPDCARERTKDWIKANPDKWRAYQRQHHRNAKEQIFKHYGEGLLQCSLCNETRIDALSIDHINGNGARHRRQLGLFGTDFYRWLIKNNFPEGYRVLCMNCQFIERAKTLKYGTIKKEEEI